MYSNSDHLRNKFKRTNLTFLIPDLTQFVFGPSKINLSRHWICLFHFAQSGSLYYFQLLTSFKCNGNKSSDAEQLFAFLLNSFKNCCTSQTHRKLHDKL